MRCCAARTTDYLAKPFDLGELLLLAERALAAGRLTQEVAPQDRPAGVVGVRRADRASSAHAVGRHRRHAGGDYRAQADGVRARAARARQRQPPHLMIGLVEKPLLRAVLRETGGNQVRGADPG